MADATKPEETTDAESAVVEGQNHPENQPDALGEPGSQHDPEHPAVPTDTLPWTADAPNEPAATAVTDVKNTPEAKSLSEPDHWNMHVSAENYVAGLKAEMERTVGEGARKIKADIKAEIDRIEGERAVATPKETA